MDEYLEKFEQLLEEAVTNDNLSDDEYYDLLEAIKEKIDREL